MYIKINVNHEVNGKNEGYWFMKAYQIVQEQIQMVLANSRMSGSSESLTDINKILKMNDFDLKQQIIVPENSGDFNEKALQTQVIHRIGNELGASAVLVTSLTNNCLKDKDILHAHKKQAICLMFGSKKW